MENAFSNLQPLLSRPNNGQSAVADGFLYFYFGKIAKKRTVKKG
jgi:hypothetical protein